MPAEFIRALLLLAIFALVFLATQFFGSNFARGRAQRGAVNKRLRMIGSGQDREVVIGKLVKNRPTGFAEMPRWLAGPTETFEKAIFTSGVPGTLGQVTLLIGIAVVVLFFLTLLIASLFGVGISFGSVFIILIFALALGAGMPIMIISKIAENNRKKMERQFPIALDIFVRALKSGHPVASAIDLLTKEMDDPIGSEFGLISDEIAYGADLVGSLQALSDRWDLDDMKMFVVSLSVQSQTGGNLAEILENISKVIRDRAQMFMKVRALSSEGRMTAWMLSVLPIFAFFSIFLTAPQYYLASSEDPVFIYGFIGLVIMWCLGVYVIRRLVDLKV